MVAWELCIFIRSTFVWWRGAETLGCIFRHSRSEPVRGLRKHSKRCPCPRAHPEHALQRGRGAVLHMSGVYKGDSQGWPSHTPAEHVPDYNSDLLLVPSVTSERCCLLPALPECPAQAAPPALPSSFCLFLKQRRAGLQQGN